MEEIVQLRVHGNNFSFAKPCVYLNFWIISFRELSHPNIVKFYGTNLQRGRNGTTVVIILELCSCSLSYHVMSHPEEAPARLPKEAVMKKVLGWALNILDALRYIHSEGFVHRDLKLDNILVSSYRGLWFFFISRVMLVSLLFTFW